MSRELPSLHCFFDRIIGKCQQYHTIWLLSHKHIAFHVWTAGERRPCKKWNVVGVVSISVLYMILYADLTVLTGKNHNKQQELPITFLIGKDTTTDDVALWLCASRFPPPMVFSLAFILPLEIILLQPQHATYRHLYQDHVKQSFSHGLRVHEWVWEWVCNRGNPQLFT